MKENNFFNREYWVKYQSEFQSRLNEIDNSNLGDFLKKEFPRASIFPFVGMKRSGNHAIINWMIQNCWQSTVYLNSLNENMSLDMFAVYHADYLKPNDVDRVIITLENRSPAEFLDLDYSLVARDPFNWLGSWISHFHFSEEYLDKDIEMYIRNMKEIDNKAFFNKWFSDTAYRDSLAHRLGFTNYNRGIETVTNYGKGSSFDRKKYNGRASEMKVLNRWEEMRNNVLYVQVIKKYKNEFITICNEYFPNINSQKIINHLDI